MTWEPIEEKRSTTRRLENLKHQLQDVESKNFYSRESGRVADIIARRVGLGSGVTYEKGKEVIQRMDEAFARFDEKEGDLIRITLNEQSISAAHKLVSNIKQMEDEQARLGAHTRERAAQSHLDTV